MSVYSVHKMGWRYDFILNGVRYASPWLPTKAEARKAEAEKREELLKPPPPVAETPIDMAFLELVNKRLDHVQAYNSKAHYVNYVSLARTWLKRWGKLKCSELREDMIEQFVLERKKKVSAYTANREIRHLRALFNFGMKKKLVRSNPTQALSFLPVEKKIKYVPPKEDVLKVILAAKPEAQNYLWVIRETMGRMGEINRLTWQDVNLDERYVVLYTRKKKGGHLTPRKVPMTGKLFDVLSSMFKQRDKSKPWVFWQRYWDRKAKVWVEGPYQNRSTLMTTLCKRAGVKYFRYHALRHFGASVLDQANVNLGAIQRILGHENRSTTEIYLHSIGDTERDAMLVFERAVAESHIKSHIDGGNAKAAFSN